MITLIRWYMVKSKEIKYKLALWQFVDRLFTELSKNPEEIEQKIVDSITKIIVWNKTETER